MFKAIFKIISNISGHFTPERMDKSKRTRRTNIENQLRKLKRKKWNVKIARKVETLEKELQKINISLGS